MTTRTIALTTLGALVTACALLSCWLGIASSRSAERVATTDRIAAGASRAGENPSTPIQILRHEIPSTDPHRAGSRAIAGVPTTTHAALRGAIEELVAASGSRPLPEVERLLEELLERYASDPAWCGLLLQTASGPPLLAKRELAALALIARCWLAQAFEAGRYQPAMARRFVQLLIERAAGPGADRMYLDLLRGALCQSEDRKAAPQLQGLPELGSLVLALLPDRGAGREALLDLLCDWGARNADQARALLMGLLAHPETDLRLVAYRSLLRAERGDAALLMADLRGEPPELAGQLLSWMGTRADLFPPAKLISILRSLPVEQVATVPSFQLGLQLCGSASGGSSQLLELFRELRGEPGPTALKIREAILIGLGTATPTGGDAALLHEAVSDPELAHHALQSLARIDPQSAALRILDCATSVEVGRRIIAVETCGNLLRDPGNPPMEELLTGLVRLLEDARLSPASRARLADRLAPFRPRAVADWRQRTGLSAGR